MFHMKKTGFTEEAGFINFSVWERLWPYCGSGGKQASKAS